MLPRQRIHSLSSKVTSVNGLKVVIHEKGTLPPVLRSAIDIAPGTSTNIGLIMKKFKRLNAPYDKCYEDKMFAGQNRFAYSEELCEMHVKYLVTQNRCNCTSIQYRNFYDIDNFTTNCLYLNYSTLSILSVLKNMECESSLNSSAWAGHLAKCVWPCEQTEYDVSISDAYWPQDSMIADFIFNFILPLPCESPVRFYYEYAIKRLVNNKNCCEAGTTGLSPTFASN